MYIMAFQENKSFLPKVEETDLLYLVLDEVTDPEQQKIWETFAIHNPVLAREVLKRAYIEGAQLEAVNSRTELSRAAKSLAVYVVGALDMAAKRIEATKQQT